MKIRGALVSLLVFALVASSPQSLASVTANVGFSYTFTANGVNNTVNWNNFSLGDFFIQDGYISVSPTSNQDAYDNGAMVDFCASSGCTYNSSSPAYTMYTGVGTANGNIYQGATVTNIVAGLNATLSYKFSTTTASVRVLVKIDNTTGSSLTRTVRLRTGLGCDASCYVKYQSTNGSTLANYFVPSTSSYTTSAFWTITSDNSTTDSTTAGTDPITSFAYGSAGATVSPATTITNSAGDNLFTIVDVTIPANSTRYLVFFAGLGGVTNTKNILRDAYNGVSSLFGAWNTLPSDITSDLDSTQLSQILNWNIIPPTPANVSIALTASATTAFKGTSVTITASITQPGRVTFYWNGKKIPGCINRSATTTSTCDWKPAATGAWTISAVLDPTDPVYVNANATPLPVFIFKRAGTR